MNRKFFETVIAFPAFDLDISERRKRPPINVLPMASLVEKKGVSKIRVIDGESLGLSPTDLAEEILKNKPRIVGISVYTPSYPKAKELAAHIKRLRPETVIVLGGKHPTHCYKEVLEDENVDFVVVGEGEEVFLKIILARAACLSIQEMKEALDSEAGIAFKKKRFVQLARRVDLSLLPPINWDLLYPKLKFYKQGRDNFLIESSRGCFGRCTFCLAAAYRKGVSFKPPKQFVEEMRFLLNRGFNRFFFTDDDALVNCSHITEILERIKSLGLSMTFEVNVRADSLVRCVKKNSSFLLLAKKAGLKVIHLGIESGCPEILKYCKKGINLSQIEEAIKLTENVGIITESNFIIGFPCDSERTVYESIDFALRLRQFGTHLPHVSIFMPYPGTEAYDNAVNEGLLSPSDLDLASLHLHKKPVISTKFLSKEKIAVLYHEFYSRLYTPQFIDFLKKNHRDSYTVAKSILKNK